MREFLMTNFKGKGVAGFLLLAQFSIFNIEHKWILAQTVTQLSMADLNNQWLTINC